MKIDESTLNKRIKDGNMAGVYILYGAEPVLIESYIKKIIASAEPENIEKFGSKSTLDEIIKSAETVSFFGSKTVLVNDFLLSSMDAESFKRFDKFMDDEPDCLLVFWYSSDSFDHKSAKGKKALLSIEKHGSSVYFEKLDIGGLSRLLCSVAIKNGCNMSSVTARYFIETCGNDLQNLKTELYKLIAYAGKGGEITNETIDEVAIPEVTANVFNLVRAIIYHRPDEAFGIIDGLFYGKAEPVMILGAVSSAYIDMFRAGVASKSGVRADAAAADFGYKTNKYRFTKADEMRRRLSDDAVLESLRLIVKCDVKLKSGTVDKRVLLEKLVEELINNAKN